MTLLQKQQTFTRRVAKLLMWFSDNGYEVTFGETVRSPEEAKRQGRKSRLHGCRLAIDFNLFKDGKWLTETEDFRQAGEYWESLSTPDCKCSWGGDFNDGNHFSIRHGGMR